MVGKKKRTYTRKHLKKRINPQLYIGGNNDRPYLFIDMHSGTGLGNKLYIYAAGIVEKNKRNMPLYLLPGSSPHSEKGYNHILFKQGIPVDNPSEIYTRGEKAKVIYENVNTPQNIPKNRSNVSPNENVRLAKRYYQNYEYISSAIPSIRRDFAKYFNETNPTFKHTIKSSNTAFIHVRRGDVLQLGYDMKMDFYQKALDMFNDSDNIHDIYILSDDVAWCREQKWNTTKKLLGLDPKDEAVNKDELHALHIMSLCLAGAIIGASTFSTWGAILGADTNNASLIIYPQKWWTIDGKKHHFPERWIAI